MKEIELRQPKFITKRTLKEKSILETKVGKDQLKFADTLAITVYDSVLDKFQNKIRHEEDPDAIKAAEKVAVDIGETFLWPGRIKDCNIAHEIASLEVLERYKQARKPQELNVTLTDKFENPENTIEINGLTEMHLYEEGVDALEAGNTALASRIIKTLITIGGNYYGALLALEINDKETVEQAFGNLIAIKQKPYGGAGLPEDIKNAITLANRLDNDELRQMCIDKFAEKALKIAGLTAVEVGFMDQAREFINKLTVEKEFYGAALIAMELKDEQLTRTSISGLIYSGKIKSALTIIKKQQDIPMLENLIEYLENEGDNAFKGKQRLKSAQRMLDKLYAEKDRTTLG